MWTAIKAFIGGTSIMTYVYIAAAAFVAILLWRNWEVGRERDAALQTVGSQKVVIGELQQDIDFAKNTVAAWQSASAMFQSAVAEMAKVSFTASEEGRKLHVAFHQINAPELARTDPARLERNRNLGWARLNCLLQRPTDSGACPAGPSAAGEDPGPATAKPASSR